jgi:hypothetical protein
LRTAPRHRGIALTAKRFLSDTGGPGRGRDHHDELEFGVDEDRLDVDAEQSKPPFLTWKKPELIAVAETRRGFPRRACVGLPVSIGRLEQIIPGYDLLAADRAVIGGQHAEPAIVAQDRIEIVRSRCHRGL